jgi:uncharacterized Zn-finger protein
MAGSDTDSEHTSGPKCSHREALLVGRSQNNHASRLLQQSFTEECSEALPAPDARYPVEAKASKHMGEYTLHYKMNDKTQRLNQILECTICHMTFPKLCNLRDHLRIHRGELPYECKHCGKKFTQAGNRDRHEKLRVCDK